MVSSSVKKGIWSSPGGQIGFIFGANFTDWKGLPKGPVWRVLALCQECPVTGSSLELEWARDAWVQIPDPPYSKCVILENCPKFFEITFYLLNRNHEAFLHRIDGDLIETAWKNLSTQSQAQHVCPIKAHWIWNLSTTGIYSDRQGGL